LSASASWGERQLPTNAIQKSKDSRRIDPALTLETIIPARSASHNAASVTGITDRDSAGAIAVATAVTPL
jgi:hypothetical protein